ncbi:MAG: hypothetical protein ABI690_08025 [Chloroflexota bacterium]
MQQLIRNLRMPVIVAVVLSTMLIANAQDSTPISAGDTFTGTLSDSVSGVNYDLTRSRTPLLITAASSDFTPTLGLALSGGGAGGFSVSFDGDVGNPLFIPPLPDGTTAQVQVSTSQFSAAGDFSVSAVGVDAAPISAGETLDGEIGADGVPQFFAFDAQVGKVVTITAQGGAFDTSLKLFAPGAIKSSAADSDGGVGLDPEIYQAVLAGSGIGYIEVAPAFSGDSGTFKLTLTVSDPPTLDENTPVTLRLGGERGTGGLIFTGAAGGKAEITVQGVGGDTSDATIAIYQDGIRLIWDDRYDPAGSGTYQIDMQTTSPVYIIITADTRFGEFQAGQFEVSFKRQ